MYIILATDSTNLQRAFVKETEKKAQNLIQELKTGGWKNVVFHEVDSICYEFMTIKTN